MNTLKSWNTVSNPTPWKPVRHRPNSSTPLTVWTSWVTRIPPGSWWRRQAWRCTLPGSWATNMSNMSNRDLQWNEKRINVKEQAQQTYIQKRTREKLSKSNQKYGIKHSISHSQPKRNRSRKSTNIPHAQKAPSSCRSTWDVKDTVVDAFRAKFMAWGEPMAIKVLIWANAASATANIQNNWRKYNLLIIGIDFGCEHTHLYATRLTDIIHYMVSRI